MTNDTRSLRAFRALVLTLQTLFGAWFLIHGLNHWIPFFPQPPGSTGPANDLLSALIQTGMFTWVKAIEVVVGVLLLLHWFVPVAIVIGAPVTFSIAYFNLALHHDTFHTITGSVILIANAVMALGYTKNYRAMLEFNAGMPELPELKSWRRPSGAH